MTTTIKRDSYNAIVMSSLDPDLRNQANELMVDAQSSAKTDEHGNWDFGCEFDRKGRGSALNWDLYGVGHDAHSGKLLIVIQVRQFIRRSARRFPEVRKNYFLVGTNEDASTFAHSVESRVIHSAIKAGRDVVLSVQNWIFDGDYARMVRHGDLALIPCSKRPSAPTAPRKKMVLEGSHELSATAIRQNGHLYAKNPTLTHAPGTHPTVKVEGWYKVVVGNRAEFWKFAAPTID
jgi:hypothetical protein